MSTENISRKTRKQTAENAQLAKKISNLEQDLRMLRMEKDQLKDQIERTQRATDAGLEQRRKNKKDVSELLVKANLQLKRQIESLARIENQK